MAGERDNKEENREDNCGVKNHLFRTTFGAIDVSFTTKIEKELLEQYLEVPSLGTVPILPLGPLIAMKLMVGRFKDKADVCEMVKRRGLREVEAVMKYIAENMPSHAGLMAELIAAADNERIR